jgi:hypothetical protein
MGVFDIRGSDYIILSPSLFSIFHYNWLVVWNMKFMTFHIFIYIGNFIIPTDEVIFFRGVGIPPTRYNIVYFLVYS